jgi:hypothetical protein
MLGLERDLLQVKEISAAVSKIDQSARFALGY